MKIINLIILTFLIIGLFPNVYAETFENDDGTVIISVPEIVDTLKPFEVKVKILDKNILDNLDYISSYGCNFKKGFDCTFDEYSNCFPNGEAEFSMNLMTYLPNYDTAEELKRECTFELHPKEGEDWSKEKSYIDTQFNLYPVDSSFSPIEIGERVIGEEGPSSINYYYYGTEDSNYGSTSIGFSPYFGTDEKSDFDEEKKRSLLYIDAYRETQPGFTLKLDGDVIYTYIVDTSYLEAPYYGEDYNHTEVNTEIEMYILKDYGYVSFSSARFHKIIHEDGEGELSSDDPRIKSIIDGDLADYVSMGNSYSLSSKGSTPDVEEIEDMEDADCTTDADCGEGYACTLCETCKKEEDVYDEDEVEITSVDLEPEFSSKKIYNKVTSGILVKNHPEITWEDEDGVDVDACEIEIGSFDDLKITAEIDSDDPYAGFSDGIHSVLRNYKYEKKINFVEGGSSHSFLISPNDRVKEIGNVKDIVETVIIRVTDGTDVYYEDDFDYTLIPIQMSIDIKANNLKVQQDSSRAIPFTVNNPTAKYILTRIRVATIGGIELSNTGSSHAYTDDKLTNKYLFSRLKPNQEYKLAYYAPDVGGMDLNKALQSLSMWDLQVEAHKKTLVDAAMNYGGEYLTKGAKQYKEIADRKNKAQRAYQQLVARHPGQNSESAMKMFSKGAFESKRMAADLHKAAKFGEFSNFAYNTNQAGNAKDTMVRDAKTLENYKGGPTALETVMQVGITGIDAMQMTVSTVCAVTNKVPVIGKLGAGLQTAFSWATNVWRANFEYIATDERLGRAKEVYIPVVVIFEASDESGWVINNGMQVQIAYHSIEG